MEVKQRNSIIRRNGPALTEPCGLPNADREARYVSTHLFHEHRGVHHYWGDMILAFGNDGFEEDERSQHVVAVALDAGRQLGLIPRAFGLCSEGYTWVLVLAGAEGDSADSMVHEMGHVIWTEWLRASGLQVEAERLAEEFSGSMC